MEENSLLALKAAEFASPAIKTTLTPNTDMESVQQERKKLLTNTLALGDHMHAQTNNVQKKHRLSQQIEGWQTSLSFPHIDCEYNDSWRAEKHLLLKRRI